ncbi:Uncharacterized protein FWK35_00027396 [Aphis craccivora]|uniref:Uncharacterized protein n=1 Tax=Aphis craccivora TaxID=307492 RepID=A0A6G0ZG98_APHCR|nr:Uncharacterized protein FWK35_00027396 [Aphis craccivora]
MLQFQTLGVVSDSKVNLFGAFGRSFFEYFNSFQKIEKNKKKNDGKTGIFMLNQFSTKSIFLYGCN